MKIRGLWIAAIAMVFSAKVFATLEIVITEGMNSARPIGVVPFKWKGQGALPGEISEVVMADLMRSGKFNPVSTNDMPQYPETAEDVDYSAWATMGVDIHPHCGPCTIINIFCRFGVLWHVIGGHRIKFTAAH